MDRAGSMAGSSKPLGRQLRSNDLTRLLVALEAEHEPDPGDRDGPIELARWKHDADPPIE